MAPHSNRDKFPFTDSAHLDYGWLNRALGWTTAGNIAGRPSAENPAGNDLIAVGAAGD